MSAVDGKPYAGSTRVRGSAVGDSLNLLCLVLLGDVRYSFITTFDITETSAKSTAE